MLGFKKKNANLEDQGFEEVEHDVVLVNIDGKLVEVTNDDSEEG